MADIDEMDRVTRSAVPSPVDRGDRPLVPCDDTRDPHENLRRELERPSLRQLMRDDLLGPREEYERLLEQRERRQNLVGDDLVETPLNPHDLCLNPGADEDAPENPLCPVCEEPIRPVTGEYQRRFECGCAVTWRFTFDEEGADD